MVLQQVELLRKFRFPLGRLFLPGLFESCRIHSAAYYFFDVTDRQSIRQYLFVKSQLHFRVLDREQCTCVPHIDLLILQPHLYLGWELQKAEIIGNRRPLLADTLAQLFLRQAVTVDQLLVSQGYFYRVQIFALDILDQSHLDDILVCCGFDIGGDTFQASHQGSAIPTFARDNHIFIRSRFFQRNRLNDTQ